MLANALCGMCRYGIPRAPARSLHESSSLTQPLRVMDGLRCQRLFGIASGFLSELGVNWLVWNLIGGFVSGGGSMLGSLQALFDNANLAPHGICLLWRPELIWLHVASDALI